MFQATRAKYSQSYRKENFVQEEINVGNKVLYSQPCKSVSKLDSIWSDIGTVLIKAYNSFRIRLEDGREVVANKKHVRSLSVEECCNMDNPHSEMKPQRGCFGN